MIEALGDQFKKNPLAWMETQARKRGLSHLLAFADNGVIRGEVKNGNLKISSHVRLHPDTLQRAHLFGSNGELRISRQSQNFESVWLEDQDERFEENDETYLLWSNDEVKAGEVIVRHYVRYDDQGQAYISHSRLVDIRDA